MHSKWIRRAALALIVVVACVVGLLGYIDRSQFEPYWQDIRKIAGSIPDQELHLAGPQRQTIIRLVSANGMDAQSQLDWQVSRRLLRALHHDNALRPLRWQSEWFLWYLEIRGRFSPEERFALYCHLMQFKGGEGLLYGSRTLFGTEPNQLTDDELAVIIAIQRSGWRHYERHPEKLAPDGQELLRSKM